MFINIGNKAFVNADKIKFIVGADTEKVRRELANYVKGFSDITPLSKPPFNGGFD